MRTRWVWAAALVAVAAAIGCGSKSATCATGAEGCACFANDSCFAGLTCASHLCVNLGGSGGAGRGGGSGQAGTSGAGGSAAGTAGAAGSIATAGTSGSGGTAGAAGATAGAGGTGGATGGAGGTAGAAGTAGSAGIAGAAGSGGGAGAAGSAGAGGAAGAAGAAGGGGAAGAGGRGGSSVTLGCELSDLPSSAIIADFAAVDGGVPVIPIGGTFVYPNGGGPMAAVVNGAWRITAVTTGMTSTQYLGVGIYFNGNAAGTDCVDATPYTGIKYDIRGTIAGPGCSAQFAIDDSEHTDAVANPNDPKAAGAAGSYQPQLSLTVTTTAETKMIPFSGVGSPTNGNPAVGIDESKLTGMQWQFTTAQGTGNSCAVDVTIDNVTFYY